MTAMMSIGRRLRQRFAGDQIDFSALPLLRTLQYDGPLRLSALAAQLGLDASTVSRHVAHLEKRGMLDRTDHPEDGRASRVMVSEQGKTCLENGARVRRDQSIVGTALPRITSELGGLDKLSWVVTAYLLTATASTPAVGQDLRPLRPTPALPGRHRHLPDLDDLHPGLSARSSVG